MQQLRACRGGAAREKNRVQLGRGCSVLSPESSALRGYWQETWLRVGGRQPEARWERGLQFCTRRHGLGEEGRAREWPGHRTLQGGTRKVSSQARAWPEDRAPPSCSCPPPPPALALPPLETQSQLRAVSPQVTRGPHTYSVGVCTAAAGLDEGGCKDGAVCLLSRSKGPCSSYRNFLLEGLKKN